MERLVVVVVLSSVCPLSSPSPTLLSGQSVCRRGVERPCYKVAYSQDVRHRAEFGAARRECERDGGHLLSVQSLHEQRFVQKLLEALSATDGDFWIGLMRSESEAGNLTDCAARYHWLDGSHASFRNWYEDEPSCGSEACVVMYHQPTASAGMGGPYLYQWNDDRCNIKNNFICKYSAVRTTRGPSLAPDNTSRSPDWPTARPDQGTVDVKETDEASLNILYIVLPTIPLLLLLLVATSVFCFRLVTQRRKERQESRAVKEPNFWLAPETSVTPSLEIHKVIRRQTEDDLSGSWPHTRNSSFRVPPAQRPADTLSGEYDNVRIGDTQSGFVTNEIYEPCVEPAGRARDRGWVDNEIYGY